MGRWVLLLAAIVAVGGCIDDNLVACDDGRVCPTGTACDVVHQSCVAPDQLTACAGRADQTACTATGVPNGRRFDGVCIASGCGNGFVEPGELCDDGNQVPGDNCSALCDSREVCGDGFIDRLRGEECDDSNTRSRDGCTAHCTLEAPRWNAVYNLFTRATTRSVGAYDPMRRATVVFGGVNDDVTLNGDTSFWNGESWTLMQVGAPPPRNLAAMAYDPIRHETLLYGGIALATQGLLANDTWVMGSGSWIRKHPTQSPPARAETALAWDGSRIIMYGGNQLSDALGDTWAWDGEDWSIVQTAHSPGERVGHAMTFDAKHDRLVMFGGLTTVPLNDTWIFDGGDWSRLTTNTPPPPMQWEVLVYDTKRQVVMLVGMTTGNVSMTYELDGSTWTERANTGPGLIYAAVAYDQLRDRITFTNGEPPGSSTATLAIWEWDGASWAAVPAAPIPAARQLCSLAADRGRGRLVLFGGDKAGGSPTSFDDTWEWDGTWWRSMSPSTKPPGRSGATFAYDGIGTLMFGGFNAGTNARLGDTWRWDGTNWTAQPVGPSQRRGAAMAYDVARKRVVLFGGEDTTTFADTWEWDGSVWTQVSTPVAPLPRGYAALAYDEKRQRIVMFGGVSGTSTVFDDTWEWDGTTWTERTVTVKPEKRTFHQMFYDTARERIVMYGGLIGSFSLWEWDGTDWRQPDVTTVPLSSLGACSAYDVDRRQVIEFGGIFLVVTNVTFAGSYAGSVEEICESGLDLDDDGLSGCLDDDCAARCTSCGNGACGVLEQGRMCPMDCPLGPAVCGDAYCATAETCSADCP